MRTWRARVLSSSSFTCRRPSPNPITKLSSLSRRFPPFSTLSFTHSSSFFHSCTFTTISISLTLSYPSQSTTYSLSPTLFLVFYFSLILLLSLFFPLPPSRSLTRFIFFQLVILSLFSPFHANVLQPILSAPCRVFHKVHNVLPD